MKRFTTMRHLDRYDRMGQFPCGLPSVDELPAIRSFILGRPLLLWELVREIEGALDSRDLAECDEVWERAHEALADREDELRKHLDAEFGCQLDRLNAKLSSECWA
ncbi:MAG: hypothetical protein P1P84_05315 [Deferrisomatales bacterium]|nr:hypothetical protein [Deferrisomatales bacterium]